MTEKEFKEQYNIFVEDISKQLLEYWDKYLELNPAYKFSIDEMRKSVIENVRGRYVYFMKNKYNGYIKIGFTTNIKSRLRDIKSICKNYLGEIDAIELLGLIDTSFIEPIEFESFLHKKYKRYNVFGEWFDFPKEVWSEIEEYYLFDFEYDDKILFSDLEKFQLKQNQLHGIGYVGNPLDNEFMEFLYGRYKNVQSPTKDDIKQLAERLIYDVYGIKCEVLYQKIFNQSFYNYVWQEYMIDLAKTFCAMCEAYRQSPTDMFQQTTPKIKVS